MKDQQTVWVVSNIQKENLLPLSVDEASCLEDLPEEPPFAVVLSKNEGQNWVDLLRHLRQKKAYRYTPVFYHGDVEPLLQHLFDGAVDDNVVSKASHIYERIATFGAHVLDSDDKETVLLAYMYSRGDLQIKGCINPQSKGVFEYPLLNTLFSNMDEFDGWAFLQDLVMRDLLMHAALMDEIKTCSACEAGLLNIRNSCPNCHSIDIKPQKFVHCFSCGKIGPVPEFLREERLICGRCRTKLHELGVDYEKTREDKLCNSCGHFFAESEVDFVCLVCHHSSPAQGLTSRRLYDYALTRRSEYVVRGIEKSIYRNFSHFFKVIDYDAFLSIAGWQAKLAERYSNIYFSIMSLQITNSNELLEQLGEVNAERMMGQFFTSLRQVFRESDLSSRIEGTMYFLLPLANQDGCLVIIERIKNAMQQLAEENIGRGLLISANYLTSFEILQSKLDGEMVIAELEARLTESNTCLIVAK